MKRDSFLLFKDYTITAYSVTKCPLLCTNTILFTYEAAKLDRFACSVRPAIEKTLSHGALGAGTARIGLPRANTDSLGNVSVYPFHHCSKSSETSDKHRYCCSSRLFDEAVAKTCLANKSIFAFFHNNLPRHHQRHHQLTTSISRDIVSYGFI